MTNSAFNGFLRAIKTDKQPFVRQQEAQVTIALTANWEVKTIATSPCLGEVTRLDAGRL